jgi:hypothetical protein
MSTYLLSPCDASSRLAASKTTGSHVRNNLPHFYVAGPFLSSSVPSVIECPVSKIATYSLS